MQLQDSDSDGKDLDDRAMRFQQILSQENFAESQQVYQMHIDDQSHSYKIPQYTHLVADMH
ncbi:hypothetical protein RhiirA4_412361 [Rhizophagus irregularis]|uniref:Uncharacterized protein n=1 Tax=Rhizophagus irregularis TaxID=588596 RepID=A0A2I1HK67_9GLOM|nr:hypothetical protein RhiirA4_412361 [Rhizophagus irregularis]